MAAANIQITQGSGTRMATSSYTEGGVTVHDEKVILGEQYLPTYAAITGFGVSVATALAHPFQLMAGSSLRLYVRRLMVYQVAAATTAGFYEFLFLRLTTAGTGGTTITPSTLDPSDGASGASGMFLPTAKGTEGNAVWRGSLYFTQTIGASLAGSQPALLLDLDFDKLRLKPPVVAAGTSNGLALRTTSGIAGASIVVTCYFTEASF